MYPDVQLRVIWSTLPFTMATPLTRIGRARQYVLFKCLARGHFSVQDDLKENEIQTFHLFTDLCPLLLECERLAKAKAFNSHQPPCSE